MGERPPQPGRQRWTLRSAAVSVVETLQRAGFTAYFAGGCVRDEIMGLAPKDYDVATDARPEQVQSLFRGTRAVGESFGVILVNLHGHAIEVATFRADIGYTDKRRPDQVVFTTAEKDARRRDFTINGLFEDPIHNRIIDFVDGQADIRAGVVRAIGDPAARLNEDHLRALRAVRFAARFDFAIDAATAEAIRRDAIQLQGVSRERIGQEVRLMLTHASRARAADTLQSLSLDGPSLNEPTINPTPAILRGLPPDVEYPVALVAWSLDRGEDRRDVVGRWRAALMLSNEERDLLRMILRAIEQATERWGELTVAQRKRLAGSDSFAGAMAVLRSADPALHDRIGADVMELERSEGGVRPDPLLSGDHLISMGMTPGPAFKSLLDAVYDAQLEGRVRDLDSARRLARDLAGRESRSA